MPDTPPLTKDELAAASARLEGASPREVLAWAFDTFAPRIVQATSFGVSGIVLAHLTARLRPETTIFYLDTGLLFPETYALAARLEAELGVRFTRVQPALSVEDQAAAYGEALWARDPDACCALRKVAPLESVLAGQHAWITGVRRDQSATRAATPIAGWDAANGLVKINPLALWSEEDVWTYLRMNDLPYNPLHDDGYPSIGCMPCTARVAPGADPRSGRWAGRDKTECGIHLRAKADAP